LKIITFNKTNFLIILEAPLEFIRPLTDIELKENQNATFECELNKSGVEVKWFRNGEPIKDNGKDILIDVDGKVHTLTLKKVDSANAAKYTAKTVGPSSSALLYVEGKNIKIQVASFNYDSINFFLFL
jgi:hypothetical protein